MTAQRKAIGLCRDNSCSDNEFHRMVGDLYAQCRCFYQCWNIYKWVLWDDRNQDEIVDSYGSGGLNAFIDFRRMMREIPSHLGLTVDECLEIGKSTFEPEPD